MLGRLASSAGLIGKVVGQQLATAGLEQAAAASGPGLLQQLARRCFATNSHDIFNVHRPSAENNWNTEFDFTPANYKKARRRRRRAAARCRACSSTVFRSRPRTMRPQQ